MEEIMKLKGMLASKGDYERAGYFLSDMILKAYQSKILMGRIWSYVARIAFDPTIPTAQINLKTGHVKMGVAFFIQHIETLEDLLFLLIHERNHFILEHSVWRKDLHYLRRSVSAPIAALIEDAFINGPAYRVCQSDLSNRFYRHNTFEVILTSDTKGVKRVFKDKTVGKLHAQLFDVELPLPDFGDYSVALIRWFMEKMDQQRKDTGNDQKENTGDESDIEKQAESITPIVDGRDDTPIVPEDRPQTYPVAHSVTGNEVTGRQIKAITPRSEIDRAISTLTDTEKQQFQCPQHVNISRVDSFISSFQCLKAGNDGIQGYTSTVPHRISKRDLNAIRMNNTPVIWNTIYEAVENRTKLYMDVSGSMESYLGLIPYLFDRVSEHVDEIFEFSDSIVPVEADDTFYYSTDGTDFVAVAQHILQNQFSSIIIITDGQGQWAQEWTDRLKEQLEYCAYIKVGRVSYGEKKNWDTVAHQIVQINPR